MNYIAEEHEVLDKIGMAKRIGCEKGYLYSCNGDNPGIAETLEEATCGDRVLLGEIGKDTVEGMALKLRSLRS